MASKLLQGGLDWPLENERSWVALQNEQNNKQPNHRVLVHARLGLIFEDHGMLGPEAVALEAKVFGFDDYCGCHLIALWWQDLLTWRRGQLSGTPGPFLRELKVTLEAPREALFEAVFAGTAYDIQFLSTLLKVASPGLSIHWR